MIFIYCSDPMQPQRVDVDYEEEAQAAASLGVEYSLISFEALVNERNPQKAVRRVAQQEHETLAVYRGWMLRPEQYGLLYSALLERGVRLINDHAAYKYCHHLPEWYPALADKTPRSVWLLLDDGFSIDRVMELLAPFGNTPLILKDYVKSRKHEWAEACFIPSAADRQVVERVAWRFIELQGKDLNEGLVFREFKQFEPIGTHQQSGMPLTREYRLFCLDGAPLSTLRYWEQGDYDTAGPPLEQFQEAIAAVPSRFFTMDVARLTDGTWQIVELGDGQVAGLPEHADVAQFYRELSGRLAATEDQ